MHRVLAAALGASCVAGAALAAEVPANDYPTVARADYGVVLEETSPGGWCVDLAATATLRDELRHRRGGGAQPMIERGPGYEQMLRGECAPRMRI